jgi:hypothetical protein
MKVRIPPNVKTAKRGDGTEVVELYVSAPTGISNRLLIPVKAQQAQTPAPAPQFQSSPASAAYVVADTTLTLRVNAVLDAGGTPVFASLKDDPIPPDSKLRLLPLAGNATKDPVDIRFIFPYSSSAILEPIVIANLTPDPSTGVITLNSDQLKKILIKQLVDQITKSNLAIIPTTVLLSRSIEVQPHPKQQNDPIPPSSSTTNPLTVNFEFVIQPAPAKAAAAAAKQTALMGPIGTIGQTSMSGPPMMGAPARDYGGSATGLVPANALEPAADTTPNFRFASRGNDPMTRRISADNAEFAQISPFRALNTDSGSVVRTQSAPAPPAGGNGGTITLPGGGTVAIPGAGGTVTIPGTGNTVTIPNPGSVVIPNPAGPQQAAHSLVVVPRTPPINVTVPVTNNNTPPRHSGGLFHRQRTPATPQNPTRPSLLERLRGGR